MASPTTVESSLKTDSPYGYSPQYPLVPFTDFGTITPDTPLES